MDAIWNAAIHSPWWVYVLFIYCMFIGYKASKTGIVPLGKLIALPAIFLAMSIETLINSFKITPFLFGVWIFAIIVGTGLGWLQICKQAIRVDKEKKLFEVPGTWLTAIVIFLIFAVKYYFGYELAADPGLTKQTTFEVAMLFLSGAFSGLFVGKLLNFLYRLKTSPHTPLDAS